MRLAGYVAQIGVMRIAYSIFVDKPESKRPRRRPGHRWYWNWF